MIFGLFDERVDDLGPLSVRNPVLLHLKFKQNKNTTPIHKAKEFLLAISLWKRYMFDHLQPDCFGAMSSNC